MRYAEYPPPPELAEWIACFWVFESKGFGISSETIVADGFPELIVHFGCPFSESDHNGLITLQPKAVASGQLTGPLILHSPDNAGIVSIRFRPSGMIPFTSIPMRLLTNVRLLAKDVFENADEYVNQIQLAFNDIERVTCAINFLLRSFKKVETRLPTSLAVDAVVETQGNISVETLAKKLDMGHRNLELRFLKDVGVTPKQFCRIIRFRRAYDLLTESSSQAASVALETGFFDQSHLIRDFRMFAGATPAKLIDAKPGLSHALIFET